MALTFNKVRGALYWTARRMGDAKAVDTAVRKRSVQPIASRAGRVILGRLFGMLMGRL